VDEQGFDFKRPAGRREPKRFEPPPWEKDAFDELQKRKSEEEAKAAEIAAVLEQASEPEPAAGRVDEAEPDAPEVRGAEPEEGLKGGQLDERQVLELMAGLAAEEPPVARGIHKVAIATGMGLMALGAVLLIWGMAALVGSRQTGSLGQVGGLGLGFFGAFFMGMGLWLIYRTLKQRGVL
jgi:hypothetical protein